MAGATIDPTMGDAITLLHKLGFRRTKGNFDEEGLGKGGCRPMMEFQECDHYSVKVVIGPRWVTIWSLEKPNAIDMIESARTEDHNAIKRLVRKVVS